MTIKEINTYTFIGNLGGQEPEREWKEIDEERDVLHCTETFERPCLLLKPLSVLTASLQGENGEGRRLPVLSNDDVSIELVTGAFAEPAPASRENHEVSVQIGDAGTVPTSQGDFDLSQGDLLALPPGVARPNPEGGTRLVVRAKKALHVAKGYPVKDDRTTAAGCVLLKPGEVLDQVEEGPSGGKHFELIENEDIMIEMTVRSDSQRIYHRGFNQDEVAFQLTGRRPTRTTQGEFMLETGDMLWIPPGCSHRNMGEMLTKRIILYTRNPLALSQEYTSRAEHVAQAASGAA